MADVTQLKADLNSLTSAVADDQAAIASVQSYVQAQSAEIINLEQQLATLKSTGGQDLDLTQLQASIAALRTQNQLLSSVIPAASTPPAPTVTPTAPDASATPAAVPAAAASPVAPSVGSAAVPATVPASAPVVSPTAPASVTQPVAADVAAAVAPGAGVGTPTIG